MSLLLFVLSLTLSCSSATLRKQNYDDGSPLYQQAKQFHAFAMGTLEKEGTRKLRKECAQKKASNPFCFSVRRSKIIFRYRRQKEKIARPIKKKKVIPAKIRFSKKGKLLNSWNLRRAKIPALLSGLSQLSRTQLETVATTSLRIKKCPHRLSIATAASLEDYLPEPNWLKPIAQLYERGGRCAGRRSKDREHFYTRAGLFYYWQKDYKNAARLFAKITPKDAYNGRALYWLYESKSALGDVSGAQKVLDRLLKRYPFSFHAMAGALSGGVDLAAPWINRPRTTLTRSKRSRNINKIITQAEILRKYGFDESAALLATWGLGNYRKIEKELRLYLAELGDAHTKVNTLPLLLLRHRS